jgi:hypothetical protein
VTRTDLSNQMHALADAGHARHVELREKADAFDAAADGNFTAPPTHTSQQLLGTWARARRVYSEYTGKELA